MAYTAIAENGLQYTVRDAAPVSSKESARIERALDREVAKDAKRASDIAALNKEAEAFEKSGGRRIDREMVARQKQESDEQWKQMEENAKTKESPSKMEDSKNTFKDEQSTEQSVSKNTNKDNASNQATQPTNLEKVATPPNEITDVVKDFDWTASINKQQMADKIPFIRLTEFKLTANNVLNGFAAAAMAFADLNRSTMKGSAKVGNAASAVTQGTFLAPAGGAAKWTGDKIAAGGAAIEPYRKKAEDYIKSKTNDSFGPEGQHLMDLFGNLYAREATGRMYSLPYYNSNYFDGNNSFSDTESPTVVKGMYDVIDAAGAIPSLFTTGVYVQRPKFYQFASANEPAVNISLTLYNTLTPMSYLKHAKFIQQLALNNLPRRVTRTIVEPPCIYEVFIPGKAFYPYCFISELKVSNVGTKRMINNEIVPDAFQINIRLTSLIKDASNLYERQMQHHGIGTPGVGGTGGTAGSFANGSGNNMGAAGEQRNAASSADALSETSLPTRKNDNSLESSLYNIDAQAVHADKEAVRLDARAVQFEKAGDHQRAADFRVIAASSRQNAVDARMRAADIRRLAAQSP